jgi:hypothetical protein
MHDTVRPRLRSIAAILVLTLALTAAGCDWLMQAEYGFASEARIRITGNTTVPLHLVTSTNYTTSRNPVTGTTTTNLFLADTTFFDVLPIDRRFDLRGRDRFLVRVVNPDSIAASVQLLVELDGKLVYTENAVIRDASLQYTTYFDPR